MSEEGRRAMDEQMIGEFREFMGSVREHMRNEVSWQEQNQSRTEDIMIRLEQRMAMDRATLELRMEKIETRLGALERAKVWIFAWASALGFGSGQIGKHLP